MSTPFPNKYVPLVNGQPVNAATINTPLNTLVQRTIALNEKITNALIGSATLQTEVPIFSSAVIAGMAVYRTAAGVFKAGLATLEIVGDGTTLQPSETAYIWGIVQTKFNSTLGNVVTAGSVRFTETQLRAVMNIGSDDDIPIGLLFLSATPGKAGYLTPTRPPIGITVGDLQGPDGYDGDEPLYTLLVNIGWKDPMEGHIHYHARLDTIDEDGSTNLSTNALDQWEGVDAWEAAHPGHTAPAGAVYRYVHETDDNLKNLWPPIPIGAVHYDIDGVAADLVNNEEILIDTDGIWWMDAIYLPTLYRHDFYYTRMTFKTNGACVTSLTPKDSSITITNSNEEDASVGDLIIGVNLSLDTDTADPNGLALKSVDGLVLANGPVVDGIRISSGSGTITGSSTYSDGSNTYQTGLLSLALTDPTSREGVISFSEIDGLILESINNIDVLTFKKSVAATLKGRISLPGVGLASGVSLKLQFIVWPRAVGTMIDLPMTYLKIAKPTTSPATPSTLVTTYTSITDGLELSGLGAIATTSKYSLFEVALPSTYNPGDIIYFTITRSSSDGYAGDISLLDMRWATV